MSVDTKKLRIEANNIWPARLQFPIEHDVEVMLAQNNIATPIAACAIKGSNDTEFHRFLSSILDGFDSLPIRPDRAFEAIWIPVDVEMERLQQDNQSNNSRFKIFVDHLKTANIPSSIMDGLFTLLYNVPLQACEYAARRIIEAVDKPGKYSSIYLSRVRGAIGESFPSDFVEKYLPRMLGQTAEAQSAAQRQAGSLIRNIMRGKVMTLAGQEYGADPFVRLSLFVSVILPNMRNERFHGTVFSSYRSSATSMKHYASDYFIFLLTYNLVLIILLYRWNESIDQIDIEKSISDNNEMFVKLFRKSIEE